MSDSIPGAKRANNAPQVLGDHGGPGSGGTPAGTRSSPDTSEPPVKSARGSGPRITRDRVSQIIVWTNVALALAATALSFFFSADSGITSLAAIIGTVLLFLVLLPSNLLRFDWWGRKRWIRGLARLRKPLGISSGIWFVAHSVVALVEYFDLRESLVRQFLIGDIAARYRLFPDLRRTTRHFHQLLAAYYGIELETAATPGWFAVPLALAHSIFSSLRLVGEIGQPAPLFFGAIMIFAVVEFFILRARRRGRDNKQSTTRTHAGLVVAGVAVAVLIYGASWISIEPWELNNSTHSGTILHERAE